MARQNPPGASGTIPRFDAFAAFAALAKTSLLIGVALCALAFAACSSSGPRHEDPNAFAWDGAVAPAGQVQIRNTVGSITVEPSTDNQLHVRAATSWSKGDPKKDVQFNVVANGPTVTVCAIWGRGECTATNYSSRSDSKGISFSFNSKSDARVAFTLQVPAGVRVDAMTIAGNVGVRAAAPVKARTITGAIKVGTSIGPVDAESVNGSVDVRMTTIGDTGAVRAVTKNGTAVAYVPEITDGRIETSTLNGRIGTDFGDLTAGDAGDGIGRKFATTLGAGTREYSVQSLNGSAWLRRINADGSVLPAEQQSATSVTTIRSRASSRAARNPK